MTVLYLYQYHYQVLIGGRGSVGQAGRGFQRQYLE